MENQGGNARNQDGNGNAGIQLLDRYLAKILLHKISLDIFIKLRKN